MERALPEGVRLPQIRPAGFDPLKATDEEIRLYGIPPRPKHSTGYAKWEKVMSQEHTYISPILRMAEEAETEAETEDKGSIDIKAKGKGSTNIKPSRSWCGAVNTDLANGDSFWLVQADWIVPNPYPSQYESYPDKFKDGEYSIGTWIGIDGKNGSKDILQAGIGERVKVVNHKKQEPWVRAWYEWLPDRAVFIENFKVSPGDTISCGVYAMTSTEGLVWFRNWQTQTETSFYVYPRKGIELKGTSAEWIAEYHPKGKMPIANFGSTFFNNCYAETENSERKDLKGAGLVVMMLNKREICYTEVENDKLLGVFFRTAGLP